MHAECLSGRRPGCTEAGMGFASPECFAGMSHDWYTEHISRSGSMYCLLNLMMSMMPARNSIPREDLVKAASSAGIRKNEISRCTRRGLIGGNGTHLHVTGKGYGLFVAARMGLRPLSLLILCHAHAYVRATGMYGKSNDMFSEMYGVVVKNHVFSSRFSALVKHGWIRKQRRRGAFWEFPRAVEMEGYARILDGIHAAMSEKKTRFK